MSVLTPPAVKTKNDVKTPKADKPAKAPVDPNAPKKERATRKDYGYHKDSKIELLVRDADVKPYRGERKGWYEDVQKYDGKTCGQFVEANKGKKSEKGVVQNAASWLRFFVEDKAVKLHKPAG